MPKYKIKKKGSYTGLEGQDAEAKRTPMKMEDAPSLQESPGKIIIRRSGSPSKGNIIDQRGMTREAADQMTEMERIKREKYLQKIIKGLK